MKKPAMTFAEIRQAIAAQDEKLASAHAAASAAVGPRGVIVVPPESRARLEALGEVKVRPAQSASGLRPWEMIRC